MDLEVDTNAIRVLAQGIGDVADTLTATLPTGGQGEARGLSAGSAAVREVMRSLAVAQAHSRVATEAVTCRLTEIATGLENVARAFDMAEVSAG